MRDLLLQPAHYNGDGLPELPDDPQSQDVVPSECTVTVVKGQHPRLVLSSALPRTQTGKTQVPKSAHFCGYHRKDNIHKGLGETWLSAAPFQVSEHSWLAGQGRHCATVWLFLSLILTQAWSKGKQDVAWDTPPPTPPRPTLQISSTFSLYRT